jgi:hypothetical protein
MPHSSRGNQHHPWRHRAPTSDWVGALTAPVISAWAWAVRQLKALFEALVREGIDPPTTFEGFPPGQFPPIDAIKDELFGRSDRGRGRTVSFDIKSAPGVRIARPFEGRERP